MFQEELEWYDAIKKWGDVISYCKGDDFDGACYFMMYEEYGTPSDKLLERAKREIRKATNKFLKSI